MDDGDHPHHPWVMAARAQTQQAKTWLALHREPKAKTILTIIHLPEAPNPKVGPPTLHQPRTAPTYTIVFVF